MIPIVKGNGKGISELAAFYNALKDCNLDRYNLFRINDRRNVIPFEEKLSDEKVFDPQEMGYFIGDRVYLVLSERYESRMDKGNYVGLGWSYRTIPPQHLQDGGIIVSAHGESEEIVAKELEEKLNLLKSLTKDSMDENVIVTHGDTCKGDTLCSMIGAVYSVQLWRVSTCGLNSGG